MKNSSPKICSSLFASIIAFLLLLPHTGIAEDAQSFQQTGESGLYLSLDELIIQVKERNERIQYQQLEWDISREAVNNAASIFEPEVAASYSHVENKVQNTSTERASQSPIDFLFGSPGGGFSEFTERNNEYSIAVESLVPTGAKVRIGYDLSDLNNSVMIRSNDSEYKTFIGASLIQPLLKNGGIDVTMANIHVAQADADMAMQGYRREMLQVVAEAAVAYWNLCLAQEKLGVRRESVRIAGEILRDNRVRASAGKMAQTEVLEAEAGQALRKSMEIAAQQELMAAVNNIKTLISMPAVEMPQNVVATDRLVSREMNVEFENSYRQSLGMRPEYLSIAKKIEREGIRVAYAKNQRWPQLDLKASYGLNGLDLSPGDSWDAAVEAEYESWVAGIEFRIPLTGGKKTRSELAAAKKRKQQALLELKATEVALANAVDTSIKNVRNAVAQSDQYAEAVRLNEHLLEVELARLDAGMGNSRLVLERDEDLNRARDSYLESLVNIEKALISLEAVKGTLLKNFGIDVMEDL